MSKFDKPTLKYGNLTLEKESYNSLVVTHYKGDKIPFRASTLYVDKSYEVDRNIHKSVTTHPNEDITNARTEVLEIPSNVIRDYFSEVYKWDASMNNYAKSNTKENAEQFKEEFLKLRQEFESKVEELKKKTNVSYYDDDTEYADLIVGARCPHTDRTTEFEF
jgi:signal peptidase I